MEQEGKTYYGPLFWLSIVSFIVPLIVADAAFRHACPTTTPTPNPDASGVDHALWDYLLKTYVENGLVDYDGMARDYVFRTYLNQLGAARPDKLATNADRLALLCNAYNALVINGVINHKIRDSVMNYRVDGVEFFDIKEHIFCDKTVSLNQIEHEMIRGQFREPRIHVALVCAARSCPSIRPQAYIGSRLDVQLEDQARLFANNRKYVDYDVAENTVRMSPILNWYSEDWQQVGGVVDWVMQRVEDPELKDALERAGNGEVNGGFFEYDWTLNSQASSEAAAGSSIPSKPKTDFGSGSIPNE